MNNHSRKFIKDLMEEFNHYWEIRDQEYEKLLEKISEKENLDYDLWEENHV